jgi:hypothetical protein
VCHVRQLRRFVEMVERRTFDDFFYNLGTSKQSSCVGSDRMSRFLRTRFSAK